MIKIEYDYICLFKFCKIWLNDRVVIPKKLKNVLEDKQFKLHASSQHKKKLYYGLHNANTFFCSSIGRSSARVALNVKRLLQILLAYVDIYSSYYSVSY